MLAADLLDRIEGEKESADDPEHDLNADEQRQPFVHKRCDARDIHSVPPCVLLIGRPCQRRRPTYKQERGQKQEHIGGQRPLEPSAPALGRPDDHACHELLIEGAKTQRHAGGSELGEQQAPVTALKKRGPAAGDAPGEPGGL